MIYPNLKPILLWINKTYSSMSKCLVSLTTHWAKNEYTMNDSLSFIKEIQNYRYDYSDILKFYIKSLS